MLFHTTQSYTPETCPANDPRRLRDTFAKLMTAVAASETGVSLVGGYPDSPAHLPSRPIGATLAKCDPFGTPSTSHWTGAAIIVQSPRTKTCIVTRSRTSTRPMPFSSAG